MCCELILSLMENPLCVLLYRLLMWVGIHHEWGVVSGPKYSQWETGVGQELYRYWGCSTLFLNSSYKRYLRAPSSWRSLHTTLFDDSFLTRSLQILIHFVVCTASEKLWIESAQWSCVLIVLTDSGDHNQIPQVTELQQQLTDSQFWGWKSEVKVSTVLI